MSRAVAVTAMRSFVAAVIVAAGIVAVDVGGASAESSIDTAALMTHKRVDAVPGTDGCSLEFSTYATGLTPTGVWLDGWLTEVSMVCPNGFPSSGNATLINVGSATTRTGLIFSTGESYVPDDDNPTRMTALSAFFGEPPLYSGPGSSGPAGAIAEVTIFGTFNPVPAGCAQTMRLLRTSVDNRVAPALVCHWQNTVMLAPGNVTAVAGDTQTCQVPEGRTPTWGSHPRPTVCIASPLPGAPPVI